jgi:hypothetical protein
MGYKAAIPLASGLAFVPSGATEPIVLHPSKGTVWGRPFVDYYNLRVVYHPNVYDWMPAPSWLASVGKMPPPGTVLEFIRRPEHPLGKKYPYRAVAQEQRNGSTDIRIFVDETETPDSVKWLVLHELAHVLVTAQPTLAETLRSQPRPPGYPHDDDAHEAVLEEQLANTFADKHAPVPGLDRRWWRARTRSRGYASASLPSERAAVAFWEQGDVLGVAKTLVQRSALLAGGMYLAGEREHLLRNALAGSLAIEAFVLLYERFAEP